MKKYVCPVCGYVYEGDELPEGFKCPICGVSGEKFQVVEGEMKLAAEHEFGIGTKLDPTQRMYLIMVVLGVLSWVPTCRLVRAQILAQREMEYVTAAKAMGIREHTIVFRHILPNVVSLLIVSMTLDFATCMLTESTLSYLGFGIPLPTPTWGNLLNGANNSIVIQQYWWQWVFPAVIFGICTICINLIGDGLRDALDPKALER